MDSVYNNTFVPLNAGEIWEGKSESVSKFDVAMVSCITDTSGSLQLYFSQNNINFDFVKEYELKPNQSFIINQKVEAKWFKAKVTNNTSTNQTYLRLTTIYKDDIRSDLDIRPLHFEKDTITIPALSDCIVDNKLVVSVESVTVTGVTVDISGQVVDIEGQTIKSQIYDYNNYAITSQLVGSKRGLDVNNIGTVRAYEGTIIKEVGAFTDAHNNVNLQTYDDALNDKVNSCDTIGEDTGAIKVYVSNTGTNPVQCNVNTIEDYATETTLLEIQNKTDGLNFFDNDGIGELCVFDIQNYTELNSIKGNTNRIKSDTTNPDAIQVQVKNSSLNVSGSVSVSNLPTVQDISGNVSVSNFPSTYNVSGSVNVSNQISGYATSALQSTGNNLLTDIKNKTLSSTTDSVTVYAGGENGLNIRYLSAVNDNVDVGLSTYAYSNSNPPLPATRDVLSTQLCGVNNLDGDSLINLVSDASGSLKVAVSTLPSIEITNTTFDIGNFPEIQDISGSVSVSNFPTTTNVSGSVTVSNQITGYATQTTLAEIKTNSDKLKYVGDDLKTVISNTSFDAKVRDANNNAITSTAVGIDGVRGLDVVLKNGTPADPISILIDPTNTVNVSVGNFPASYEITAGGYLSSAVGGLNVNLRNTAGDAVGISGAPLVVESNLITGYALETGGNLAGIKTNSDKFKFNDDFLKCEVVNSGTNNLNVAVSNQITGFALESGGNLASIKTNTDKNTYDGSGNLKVNLATGSITVSAVNIKDSSGSAIYADVSGNLKTNIQNTSLDTHCYGSSNGTDWHHLATDSNGQLNVHSKLQDGAGTDLTSTLNGAKQSLDVNVANIGSLKVDISGSTIVDGKLIVADSMAFPYIERISVGSGADIFNFSFGNILYNTTINTGSVSTTINITAGGYGRRAMFMYRDGAISSTDSITYYTDSNTGSPEPMLLQTVYPILNGGYRWSNVIINILPFTSIKVRNDSTTINNTNVYLTVVGV